MTDTTIIMQPSSVRAILREIERAGTGKTMTRRLGWRECERNSCKTMFYPETKLPTPGPHWHPTIWQSVKPGDRLWIRETWRTHAMFDHIKPRDLTTTSIGYKADGWTDERMGKTRVSIHMPRRCSRLTLTVTATRMERVQEISEADCEAEGIGEPYLGDQDPPFECDSTMVSRQMQYRNLWKQLHTKPGHRWEDNPEVVVLQFTPSLCNIDAMGVG
jgi:hypothetical protein